MPSLKLDDRTYERFFDCVHCGLCTESCHYVLANPGDPTYAPAYKADRIRKLFKRHFDWTGRVFPWWVKAGSLYTDEDLEAASAQIKVSVERIRREDWVGQARTRTEA